MKYLDEDQNTLWKFKDKNLQYADINVTFKQYIPNSETNI